MSADFLLSKLEHVRRVGDGWRADCPNGHAHARGSLAVTETTDGTVLMHCFACQDVHGILAAVGLEVADLFPAKPKDVSIEGRKKARIAFKQSAWAAALRVLAREATVVTVAAGTLRNGQSLTAEDDSRLTLAMQRIDDAKAVLA